MTTNLIPALITEQTARTLAWVILLAPLTAAGISLLFRKQPALLRGIPHLFSGIAFLATILIAPYGQDHPLVIHGIPFLKLYLDALSIYFVLVINMVAFFASFLTDQFLRSDARGNATHAPGWFYLFYHLFHATMLLALMVENLVLLWIVVELTTVFSAILIRYRRDRFSLEAAWKLMMITTTGMIFALLGTLFLANAIPVDTLAPPRGFDWMSWAFLAERSTAARLDDSFVVLSFLFILLGYGTKAGLAPLHSWLPDGHGEAPAPVSAFLSGGMLNIALYAILRFYTLTLLSLPDEQMQHFSNLLLAVGMLSLVLATPFIVKQNRLKRILAYHSLKHMGLIVFGIGIGSPVALFGALLHSLNHALAKALMYITYGSIQYEYEERCGEVGRDRGAEERIQGVLKAMPLTGTILAFGGLALVGSPPFSIFMSQFMILWAGLRSVLAENNLLLGIALFITALTIAVTFAGLVGHLARLLLGPAPFPPIKVTRGRWRVLAPQLIVLGLVILFGILLPTWPVDLPAMLERSVWIVQHGVTPVMITGVP